MFLKVPITNTATNTAFDDLSRMFEKQVSYSKKNAKSLKSKFLSSHFAFKKLNIPVIGF